MSGFNIYIIPLLAVILAKAQYVQAAGVDRTARIVLGCLLGGVPALSIIMLAVFCYWIRKKKRRLQRQALIDGVELDADGWPVKQPIGAPPPVHALDSRVSQGSTQPPSYHPAASTKA